MTHSKPPRPNSLIAESSVSTAMMANDQSSSDCRKRATRRRCDASSSTCSSFSMRAGIDSPSGQAKLANQPAESGRHSFLRRRLISLRNQQTDKDVDISQGYRAGGFLTLRPAMVDGSTHCGWVIPDRAQRRHLEQLGEVSG